jgi:hypothetical protein
MEHWEAQMNSLRQVLVDAVDWCRFFRIVDHVGDSMNDRKSRFDKSDMFEDALDDCSKGAVQWVDNIGWDHVVGNITMEMKSQKNCLYTSKGTLKKKTASIKLMNSLGSAEKRTADEVMRFDYLLIVDTGSCNSFSVAVLAKNSIKKEWLDFKTDGVLLQVPTDELFFVVRPSDIKIGERNKSIQCYQQAKRKMQREWLASI